MALTSAFTNALLDGENRVNIVAEVTLDGGMEKWGTDTGGFNDITPIIGKVDFLTNKISADRGFTLRGDVNITISGREIIQSLISGNYILNRRVAIKVGFVKDGFLYTDYGTINEGKIIDWSRNGDELTLTISDDTFDEDTKIPTENINDIQFLDYTNSGAGKSPTSIMTDILLTQLGIASGNVNSANFTSEGGEWLNGWLFSRVITEPSEAKKYLAQLQRETNSWIFHNGTQIDFKVFAPPIPGTAVESWTDNDVKGLTEKSGYKDNFYNKVVVYFDYDESGSDNVENFQTWVIDEDNDSQGASQHNKTSQKDIKCYWIRSFTHTQPTNITGVTIYHSSTSNGAGTGTLTFTYDTGGDHTFQWTAPSGTIGTAVTVSESGKYDVYDTNELKWVRIVVDYSNLPGSNQSDSITISSLNGQSHATTLARKILNRHRDPSAKVSFSVDINEIAHSSEFIKPTDLKDLTTDEAFERGESTWTQERVMLTSVRPDWSKGQVKIEADETKMYRRYGFIAPVGQADYPTATASERERAYIGDANNKVNGGTEDGYYIW